jgi:ADP-ribose pyrophosphatase
MSGLAVCAASKEVLRNEGHYSSFLPGSQEPGIFLPAILMGVAIILAMKNESPDLHPQGGGRGCPREGEAAVVKPTSRQQPRAKDAEASTTTLTETEIASETVFKGRLLHVKRDRVRLPDGGESTREYIVHPGAVVIIPVFENGDLLLERQHRYPLHRDFIELPAGKIDPGEDDLTCAMRELEEETGYTASEWRAIATIYPCIGYSDERLAFYLARGLKPGIHGRDPDEFLEILRVPFGEAMDWLRNGRICETKTVTGLFWLEKILQQGW